MKYLSLLIACLLSACASQRVFDENSPFSSIPVGSILVLNQLIEIEPSRVAVYLQDGKLLAYPLLNHYRPHCKFEVYTIADEPRSVEPDSFQITQVHDTTLMTSLRSLTVADNSMVVDGGGYIVTYSTIMYLFSEKQPDVYRMSCMHWDEITERRYLSVKEIRDAMGDLFSLQISKPEASISVGRV